MFTNLKKMINQRWKKKKDLDYLVNTHSFWFGEPACIYNGKENFQAFTNNPGTDKSTDAWAQYQHYLVDPDGNNILLGYRRKGKDLYPVQYTIGRSMLRNSNMLVIGPSGHSKMLQFAAPLIDCMRESYIITDMGGCLYEKMEQHLIDNGYKVIRFAPSDPLHSVAYNPLDYLSDDKGCPDTGKINEFIDVFFSDYEMRRKGGDTLWCQMARAYMAFLIWYTIEFLPAEQRNLVTLLRLAQLSKADENDASGTTELYELIKKQRKIYREARCFQYFDIFQTCPPKMQNAIVISIGVSLSPFAMDKYRHLVSGQKTIDFNELRKQHTALFIICPTADSPGTQTMLANMLIRHAHSYLFNAAQADEKDHNNNPYTNVRFIVNADTGITISAQMAYVCGHQYGISHTLICSAKRNMIAMYGAQNFENMLNYLDICVFLGNGDTDTCQWMSEYLGNTVIKYNLTERPLISPSELSRMDESDCIVKIKGLNPMHLKKQNYIAKQKKQRKI